MINARSKNAICYFASSFSFPYKASFSCDGSWVRLHNEDRSVEAHKLESGKWIIAKWNERHCQWQSSDFKKDVAEANPSSIYYFASSIEELRKQVKQYSSALDALKNYLCDDW